MSHFTRRCGGIRASSWTRIWVIFLERWISISPIHTLRRWLKQLPMMQMNEWTTVKMSSKNLQTQRRNCSASTTKNSCATNKNSPCYAIHREITYLPEFLNSDLSFPSRCRCHRFGWWLSTASIEQCCMYLLISSHWEALRHTCCLALVSNWRDPHDQDTSPLSSWSNRQVAGPTHWMKIW